MISWNSGGCGVVSDHCWSSLGKRKVECLSIDTHESDISATVVVKAGRIEANVWITDSDGRAFGVILPEEMLRDLSDVVEVARKVRDEKYA